jgi:poly-gamma-glutamate synthesis protein (capsule biosynthesis protein)
MCFGLVTCGAESQSVEKPDDEVHDAGGADSAESTLNASDDPSSDEPEIFPIFGAGDVLTHDQVVEAAEALADEHDSDAEYMFAPLMAGVEPWIAGADLALCGLEVPIVASDGQPS